MKSKQVSAKIVLIGKNTRIETKALVDTGASISIITKKLASKLGYSLLSEPYMIRTANREGYLKIIGYCRVGLIFEDVKVPGGCTFEVAENLREDVDVIIGRPEIDKWDIIFTPDGSRPRKVPIILDVIQESRIRFVLCRLLGITGLIRI